MTQTSYKVYLREELVRRLRANPRYSQRAFARQLGLSPGELSEILSGRRKLGFKSAIRIAKSLSLSPSETKRLIYLLELERSRELDKAGFPDNPFKEDSQPLKKHSLTFDMFNVVSDWYCFAIVSLADCEDFRSEPNWIAKRLGISVVECKVALDRLSRIGLIQRVGKKIKITDDYVISPEGIPSEAIRNYHRQILQKAIDSLELQSVDEREIAGVSLAIDLKHIASMKKEIADFLDEMVRRYSKGKNRKCVYQIEIGLFRLTQREENVHAKN